MNVKKVAGIALLILLFLVGVTAGYLYFSKMLRDKSPDEAAGIAAKNEDILSLRIYYPVGGQLQIEERKIPRRTGWMAIGTATIEEYFKGPSDQTSTSIPKDVKLNGLYKGADKILYVDLSDGLRRNFRGDALGEFLLLKGLYESVISNVEDVRDVKVLIDGRETETLGGHFYLLYPLKEMVSYEYH
jgi:hypothetical protein